MFTYPFDLISVSHPSSNHSKSSGDNGLISLVSLTPRSTQSRLSILGLVHSRWYAPRQQNKWYLHLKRFESRLVGGYRKEACRFDLLKRSIQFLKLTIGFILPFSNLLLFYTHFTKLNYLSYD